MSVSCQQVHLSPRAAPSLSVSPLPHDDVNVTAAGDGLEVSVTVRYRMTTDDCVPLKLPCRLSCHQSPNKNLNSTNQTSNLKINLI